MMSATDLFTSFVTLVIQLLVLVGFGMVLVTSLKARGTGARFDRLARNRPDYSAILRPIVETDPAFDWDAFCNYAVTAYHHVQQARMTQSVEPARGWVTPELFAGLQSARHFRAQSHVEPAAEVIDVTGIGPARVRQAAGFFLFDVRMVGLTTRRGRSAVLGMTEDPLPESAESDLVDIDEIWTFEPRIGAQTTAEEVHERCPNCGAPQDDPRAIGCKYCGQAFLSLFDAWRVALMVPTQDVYTDTDEAAHRQAHRAGAS